MESTRSVVVDYAGTFFNCSYLVCPLPAPPWLEPKVTRRAIPVAVQKLCRYLNLLSRLCLCGPLQSSGYKMSSSVWGCGTNGG